MYYIVPDDEQIDATKHPRHMTFGLARDAADAAHMRDGRHYNIVKVENVSTTRMLGDDI